MPRKMPSLPLDRADDGVTVSSPSFNHEDGLYERVLRADEDGYFVLRRPVTFNANVEPTFDAARVVDEDKERRKDDENKLWFEERVEGQDEDKQILERGGGEGTLWLIAREG